jgi:hypothetical protein
MCAYRSGQYASTLGEFGRPRRLENAEGWVLDRAIGGESDRDRDAMGCYPLFGCSRWDRLPLDFEGLGDLISLVLVADPFGDFEPSTLDAMFNRGVMPFKRHHVVELGSGPGATASAHHRRNARKALGLIEVERIEQVALFLDDWVELYRNLIDRHEIRGIARFSRLSFARLFELPTLVGFRAEVAGETVGMLLWLVDGEVAYYHLGAYNEVGYAMNASFALFWRSIEWFNDRVRWLDLGAGAGLADGSSGLDRFKSGWATGTRMAYLCRHVFQPERYDAIAKERGTQDARFFPSYRTRDLAEPSSVSPRGVPT